MYRANSLHDLLSGLKSLTPSMVLLWLQSLLPYWYQTNVCQQLLCDVRSFLLSHCFATSLLSLIRFQWCMEMLFDANVLKFWSRHVLRLDSISQVLICWQDLQPLHQIRPLQTHRGRRSEHYAWRWRTPWGSPCSSPSSQPASPTGVQTRDRRQTIPLQEPE